MLHLVLILSCIFSDSQANLANETYTDRHKIHTRGVTLGNEKNLCSGMSLEKCEKVEAEKLKSCQVCGLINGEKNFIKNILEYTKPESPNCNRMIIGGIDVSPPYKYPWMVTLMKGGQKTCGGAIIKDDYILTAAHCITKFGANEESQGFFSPNEIKIGFLTGTQEVEAGPPLEKILPHPKFNPKEMTHDVALLKLSSKITCGKYRNPICLPASIPDFHLKSIQKNKEFLITGWGATKGQSPKNPKKLQEGRVKMVSFKECHKHEQVAPTGYCLQGVKNQRPCFGDSGGSLYFRHKNKYYSLGVASMHTSPECKANTPFIYASLPNVIKWIQKTVGSGPHLDSQEFKNNIQRQARRNNYKGWN